MPPLPAQRYTAAQVRAMDRYLIDVVGIPGYELMCRAGEAAFQLLRTLWPQAQRILILCGSGNNAGDGYVVARLAKTAGLNVHVATLTDPTVLKGDARRAYEDCIAAGIGIHPFTPEIISPAEVLIDAIFGIGLTRPLTPKIQSQIEKINTANRPVLSLDIPSGLHPDTGAIMGAAIRATATISFIAPKQGCFINAGPTHTGALH